MHGRACFVGIVSLALLVGCTDGPGVIVCHLPIPEEEETELAGSFDPAATGTIRGQVVWDGMVPVGEKTIVRAIAFNPHLPKNPATVTTPHIPRVHAKSRGVEGAIVYLRNVDLQRSKPWDHASVRVEFHERQLLVAQGNHRSGVGFVRRGASVEIVNRDMEYHNLHGRGGAFFARPLVEANLDHEQKLTKVGIVDLTCGAGYYWLHAHLFVAEHPYYARTDADGRFVLDQVPDGKYEIVCWLPSWHVTRREVDPETAIVSRLIWAAPKEMVQSVRVDAKGTGEITYRWAKEKFPKE